MSRSGDGLARLTGWLSPVEEWPDRGWGRPPS